MKVIVNTCFGGFGVNRDIIKKYNLSHDRDELRFNKKLISLIEKGEENCNTSYSQLVVEEIPDDATDYYIEDYDGVETLLYVLNGKIIFA